MAKFRGFFRGKAAKYVTVRAENEPESAKRDAPREVPDGLWKKCDACRAVLFTKDLERNCYVCEACGCHFPVSARTRLAQLLDSLESFEELDEALVCSNPLNFPEYPEKVARDTQKTGERDAVITGIGSIGGVRVAVAVMEFRFMGGSMGSVVGEKVTRTFEKAIELGLPVVTVAASGGARMQESIFSLMQMQKTAAAVERHSRAGGLYISILTNPTLAGVFGSFATLADIIIAEPGATVGFAGKRVIEETIRKAIPPNLQSVETAFANGFIDRVVPRTELKEHVAKLLQWHTAKGPIAGPDVKQRGEPHVAAKERTGAAAGGAGGGAAGEQGAGAASGGQKLAEGPSAGEESAHGRDGASGAVEPPHHANGRSNGRANGRAGARPNGSASGGASSGANGSSNGRVSVQAVGAGARNGRVRSLNGTVGPAVDSQATSD